MAVLERDRYAGVKQIVKTQDCHRQLTVKTCEGMEEMAVKAVSTVFAI